MSTNKNFTYISGRLVVLKFPRLILLSKEQAQNANVARPILGPIDNNPVPWVALATGFSEGKFILDGNISLVDEATNNINSMPYKWEVIQHDKFLWMKRPSMARAYGDLGSAVRLSSADGSDDMSTELLLNSQAMREAEIVFGTSSLGAVVPKRGWLLIAPIKPGDLKASTPLLQAAQGIASRAGVYSICSDTVLFIQNNKICGIEVRNEREKFISMSLDKDASWVQKG